MGRPTRLEVSYSIASIHPTPIAHFGVAAGRSDQEQVARLAMRDYNNCRFSSGAPDTCGVNRMEQEGQPRQPGAAPSEGDRRAAPRHSSSLKLTCYPTGSGLLERRQARVRNVSRTGIGLAVDRSWPSGTALMIELPAEEGVKPVPAR